MAVPVSYPKDGNELCYQLEDRSFWFRHRNLCITEVVRQFPPDGVILDVGGGNGYVARALIDAGFPTALLEPGAEGAANARTQRNIPDVICATLEDAGLAPRGTAAVGLFDVLEHIDEDAGFVAKIHALLQPGGLVYATVPAHQWLWSSTDEDAGHFRRYSTTQLGARFRSAGFDILYATYFFQILLPPFVLMRTLPHAFGLRKRREASGYHLEHTAGDGRVAEWLQALLAREVTVIGNRRTLATGTSCLLVAKKR